jgi:hypothetical protein
MKKEKKVSCFLQGRESFVRKYYTVKKDDNKTSGKE